MEFYFFMDVWNLLGVCFEFSLKSKLNMTAHFMRGFCFETAIYWPFNHTVWLYLWSYKSFKIPWETRRAHTDISHRALSSL